MRLSLNRNIVLTIRLDLDTMRRVVGMQLEAIEKFPPISNLSTVAYLILRRAVADKSAEELAKEVAETRHSWLRHILTMRIDPETDAKLAEVARLLGLDGGKSLIASRLIVKYAPTVTIEDLIQQWKKELFPHLP
jgi:2-hydroxychromene-2-carboxylate isomerase